MLCGRSDAMAGAHCVVVVGGKRVRVCDALRDAGIGDLIKGVFAFAPYSDVTAV
jgi:hypothetical protein